MPPKVSYPGVFIEEVASGVRTISGVATSITVFVGPTRRGPVNRPVRIQSFQDFTRRFGELAAHLETGYAVAQYFLNGGADAWVVRVAKKPTLPQIQAGLKALAKVDLFNLLVLPGVTAPDILAAAAACCENRRAFLLADSPVTGASESDPVSAMAAAIPGAALPQSRNAAVFFPWIKIADPLQAGNLRLVPPSGTVAGRYARTDGTRGVWKAPAGTDATLDGVQEIACALTDRENGVLNPLGVNCLRVFPVHGAVCWGARTLRGADQLADEYKYVPVRRTALYIEESLARGLRWAVFEPNAEPLWAQIRLNVAAFMDTLFRQGAFQGAAAKEAYFVKCDRTTTTQDDINRGVVNLLVGFAPLKPAEFVVLKLQQLAGQVAP